MLNVNWVVPRSAQASFVPEWMKEFLFSLTLVSIWPQITFGLLDQQRERDRYERRYE